MSALSFSVRLISLASQKFISDVVNDAMQHCKMKSGAAKKQGKVCQLYGYTPCHCFGNPVKAHDHCVFVVQDKKYTLTMEDLVPALSEYGVVVKKPPYYT